MASRQQTGGGLLGQPCVEQAAKDSGIQLALKEQEEAMHKLHSRIDQLATRLSSVLRPENNETQEKCPEPPYQTEIARQIQTGTIALRLGSQKLDGIIERIDL